MCIEVGNDLNLYPSLPVIIWGTKTAAEICYRALQKKNISIAAVGDNNAQKWGEKFHGITILSAEQIKALYPNALIVVGSFWYDVSESVMARLKKINRKFSYCRFEQIEYLYETECLQRRINDKGRYWHILHNIYREEECRWKRITDKKVISEYRYIMCEDWQSDIKNLLTEVYGIKTLYLICNADKRKLMLSAVNELTKYENIGHIVPVLDTLHIEDGEILKTLNGKAFYLICGEEKGTCQAPYTAECEAPVEYRQLPDELFKDRAIEKENVVTEAEIVQSVMDYVEVKKDERKDAAHQDSRPVHIVQLFNGLANQMLMYLFGRFLEQESDRAVIFDDTILALDVLDKEENVRRISQWNRARSLDEVRKIVSQTRERNSFYQFRRAEIAEVLDAPIRLLSDYFDRKVWIKYLRKVKHQLTGKYAQSFPLGQVLMEGGTEVALVRDVRMPEDFFGVKHCFCLDTYIFSMPYVQGSVTEYMLHNRKNLYFMGIWADGTAEDWLMGNRGWVAGQIRFRPDLNERNQVYMREILESDGIMVHIRRGDFVYAGMAANAAYFRRAIAAAEEMQEYTDRKYYIFSDDLIWCQENEAALGIEKVKDRTLYITGNAGKDSYVDMYLMSSGKISIPTPGSSFSYMAMLISETMEKTIDIPRYLYDLQEGADPQPVFINIGT